MEVALASYGDSTILATGIINQGLAAFDYNGIPNIKMPMLAQLLIDRRTRGILIIEPGTTTIDSLRNASGTPLNDALTLLLAKADSIEESSPESDYIAFIAKTYNENINNPIGEYFGTELARNLDASQIDSLLKKAPSYITSSKRVKKYQHAAQLRKSTGPGAHFIDFNAPQPDGTTLSLSDFAGKGKWTLVDFWASWCPYCIKELPQLKELAQNYPDKLTIVGVAVRDEAKDTKAAIEKYDISWPVIYNAERKPYDIYGFTGIPHLMLIAPDGTIVSRGESPSQISDRLQKAN